MKNSIGWAVLLFIVSFSVSGQTTTPAYPTTEYIYVGDRALAEIHTPPDAFTDVPANADYANSADLIYADGITTGCASGQFCPTSSLTRAQMAVFIVRSIYAALNGAGNVDNFSYSPTAYFADVPAGSFGFQWIQKLYELGITSGCSSPPLDFCPNATTANWDTLVFAMRGRYCVSAGASSNCGQSATVPAPQPPYYFNDVYPGHDPYDVLAYVQAAVQQSVISTSIDGCTAGNFCEANTMTRSLSSMWFVRGILGDLSY
jgi:hypothetical protein